MNLPTEPLLRTIGRRVYSIHNPNARQPNLDCEVDVYILEDGTLLNAITLEKETPDENWQLSRTVPDSATYVLMLKWSDRWGEECIALFGSAMDANDFTRRVGLGTHVRQRVRLIL